jgi:penicillin-binding protein 1C
LQGTEPVGSLITARETSSEGAKIIAPTDGTVIALDPDIPATHQRVQLKSGDPSQAVCWRVNDAPAGCSTAPLAWPPVAGNATIKLMNSEGKELDRVTVVVRGAPLMRVGAAVKGL